MILNIRPKGPEPVEVYHLFPLKKSRLEQLSSLYSPAQYYIT